MCLTSCTVQRKLCRTFTTVVSEENHTVRVCDYVLGIPPDRHQQAAVRRTLSVFLFITVVNVLKSHTSIVETH